MAENTMGSAEGGAEAAAEAETVLEALADTLRWEAATVGSGFRAYVFSDEGGPRGWYSVNSSTPPVRVERMFWDNSVQACAKGFASVGQAKAACELHYQTHRWE